MVITIVVVLVSIMLVYKKAKEEGPVLGELLLTFTALAALVGGMAISASLQHTFTETYDEVRVSELAAMRTNNGLHGTFLLGTGSISTIKKYHYYELHEDGGYEAKSIDAKGVLIYEDQEEGGRLIVTTCYRRPLYPWLKYFIFGINSKKNCGVTYEFHIPEGSLVREFRLE